MVEDDGRSYRVFVVRARIGWWVVVAASLDQSASRWWRLTHPGAMTVAEKATDDIYTERVARP